MSEPTLLVIGSDALIVAEQISQLGSFKTKTAYLEPTPDRERSSRELSQIFKRLTSCDIVLFSANLDSFTNTYYTALLGAALALNKRIIIDNSKRLEFGLNPFLTLPPIAHCHNKTQLYDLLSELM